MKTIGLRILEIKTRYFGNERGSSKKFANAIGVAPNVVSNWFKRGDNIGREVIEKVITAFPAVDKGWLIGGNGSMLKEGTEITNEKGQDKGVPYFDVDFIMEYEKIFKNPNIHPNYLVDFEPYNSASCWCNVTGHSMEPEINHGDTIALKIINDISFIPFGDIYAIVTKNDMRMIRRIGQSNKNGCVRLFPTKKTDAYSEQDIEITMIDKLFLVLGCVKKI